MPLLDDEPSAVRRKALPIVLCIIIGAALGVWHNAAVSRGATDPFTSFVRTALSPLVAATGSAADWFSGTGRWLTRSRALARENVELRRRVAELTRQVQDLRELALTGERLQREHGLLSTAGRRTQPASVLAITPSPYIATLLIAAGKRHGIRNGSVVVGPEGVVGHVLDAGPTTSVVLVASDPRCAMGAMVQRKGSRAVGVCRGIGQSMLKVNYLERDADVQVGDTVITSGLGGIGSVYPKGLVIGSVTRVTDDAATSARIALVRMAVRIGRLEEVAVLK